MSVNLITVREGHKVALPVTTEAEYRRLRNTSVQMANLRQARQGNQSAKRRLIQFNYSGYYPNGVVKGNKLPSQAFGFDVDDPEEFQRIARLLLKSASENTASSEKNCASSENPKEGEASPLAEQLGLLMLERSASQGGHAVFLRQKGNTILENQVRIAQALDCELDTNAHDVNRVYFSSTAAPEELLFLSPRLFEDQYGVSPGADEQSAKYEAVLLENRERAGLEILPEGAHKANKHFRPSRLENSKASLSPSDATHQCQLPGAGRDSHLPLPDGALSAPASGSDALPSPDGSSLCYLGIPYEEIIRRWWQMYNDGQTPVKSNRDVLTFELALNLRHICGFDREMMDRVIPCYDGFPEAQKLKCIDSALGEKRTQMPRRLRDVLAAIRQETLMAEDAGEGANANAVVGALDEAMLQDEQWYASQLPRLPQGVGDSVEAAGKSLCMPTLIAIAPAIGALATGVKLDVHGTPRGLNLISYICGEFGSGKGQMDPIIAAWMSELQSQADIYTQQEEEWAQKTRRMKSGKAPEQPKLPVRMLPLNNTLANLAERLGNAEGKHSFSFTPEADTVALKWKSAISDFSVMLRQAYDESRYDREAKSADAVRVHIKQLLWNVTMCGTQDALYRVITNYTDGLLSRIAIARTPDNTFSPLAERPATMSEYQEERIKQVAHLLPLMEGTVVLDKLEQQGRMWLERIRLEAMKNDDRVMARQRLRGCVNAQRITCALWLPKVAEQLIRKHGMAGAETRLKADPHLWAEMLRKMQGEDMMRLFDILADYLIDNDLFYFREKIERAYESKNYATSQTMRLKHGKNDTIFARLGDSFSFEQAFQQAMAVKGSNVSNNSVKMMLRNWRKQGLVVLTDKQDYLKQQGGAVVV